MDINIIAMGQRIRSSRREKNISSEVLAEKIGIAVESLWHIENGARNTSLQTLCNIAEALDVSVDYLLGRSDTYLEHARNRLRAGVVNTGLRFRKQSYRRTGKDSHGTVPEYDSHHQKEDLILSCRV